MPSPTVFECEGLLAPIREDQPAGSKPTNIDYNKLKEYQKDFDPERDLSEEDRRNPAMAEQPKVVPQWDKIVKFGENYFQKTGKDLVVALRMVEALTKLHGFAGLRDGLIFTRRLCDDCWDRMYPVIEDPSDPDEIDGRLAPFALIDEEMAIPFFPNTVRSIPLLPTNAGVPISFANCQSYDANSQPKVSQDEFRSAVSAASENQIERIRTIDEDIDQTKSELNALLAVLDQKAGSSAPGMSGLKKAIDDCQTMTQEILRLRGGNASDSTDDTTMAIESDSPSSTHSSGGGGTALGAVRSREDVYGRLLELTVLLEKLDPHSPVPFLIRRAIEMRDLRFPELVDTLTSSKPVIDFLRAPIGDGTTG